MSGLADMATMSSRFADLAASGRGDGLILLRSKYLQLDTSTKIIFFGAFSEFLGLR